MEKVFEKPLKKPLQAVLPKIPARVLWLNKKYHLDNYRISHSWDKKNNVLRIDYEEYSISGFIEFTPQKIIGYAQIPFFLKPLAMVYQDQIVNQALKDLDEFLETIKER